MSQESWVSTRLPSSYIADSAGRLTTRTGDGELAVEFQNSDRVGARGTFTLTPLLFASALVQYNSSAHTVSANARLRWEYCPGCELFVVYNEERDSAAALGRPDFLDSAVIVKVIGSRALPFRGPRDEPRRQLPSFSQKT